MKFHLPVNHVSFSTNICVNLMNRFVNGLKSTAHYFKSKVSRIFFMYIDWL